MIPAGGMGTRLRPYTLYTPKPLLFVAGDTIIGHIFSQLDGLEIEEYRIVYSPENALPRLMSASYPDMSMSFWPQQEPLGLGHAVLQGLSGLEDEPVLVVLSDTIIPFDIKGALDETANGTGFLVAREVEDPSRFGVMEVRHGWVSRLEEKPRNPASNLAIAGIYYLPSASRLREALENLILQDKRTRGEYQLTDALELLVEQGEKLRPVPVDSWIDCGTKEALLEANRVLLSRNSRITPLEDALLKPPLWIGEGATVENSIIGPNVSVAQHAVIRNSILYDCIVNQDAVIEGVVIASTIIGEKAVIRRSPGSPQVGPFSRLEKF